MTLPQANRLYDEHTILERKDGTLVTYIRTANGTHNCLWEAMSSDGGYTWTKPHPSPVANLSSRTLVMKLRDGRWLLVKHGGFGRVYAERKNLVALVSDDEGRSWWGGLPIDVGRAPACYPDGQQLPDGSVVIVSDYNRTKDREISFVRINPDDIVGGDANVVRQIVSRTPQN